MDHVGAEPLRGRGRPSSMRVDGRRSCDAVDPFERHHAAWNCACQSTFGTRKPGSSVGVLGDFRDRRRLHPEVHLEFATERASVSTTCRSGLQAPRLRVDPLDRCARRRKRSPDRGGKRLSTPGLSTFTATVRVSSNSSSTCALMHLGDGGGRHRRAELDRRSHRPGRPSAAAIHLADRTRRRGKGGQAVLKLRQVGRDLVGRRRPRRVARN